MILIYTPKITARLSYIFDLIFRDRVGIDYQLTPDKDLFRNYSLPKLNYSERAFDDELFFYASPLLFEKGIRPQDLAFFEWNGTKAFFATHPKYAFPFDPFAAAFFLVSRYEEYLPFDKDRYGRFEAAQSVAFSKNFLQQPVVDIWAMEIQKVLRQKFPDLKFRERKYQYLSTIDIDNAYAFKAKGFMRSMGAITRNLLKKNYEEIRHRLAVMMGKEKDPFDTYRELMEVNTKYGVRCIYFFLVGNYSLNDKNISHASKKYRSLIKFIADYSEVGLHTSFASNENQQLIEKEKGRLRKITRREISKCRQHFLMLSFPHTYRNLLENDITDDYTMGYAGDVGFRAGTCMSFHFFDLEREVKTKLRIHPFALMDSTFLFYMKLNPEESMKIIRSMVEEIKKVNGTFISLWHNESLSDVPPWTGWKPLYEEMVKAAKGG